MKIEIYTYIQNNGDGSASIVLCKSLKQAEKEDKKQDEGFAESSAQSLKLIIKDDTVYIEDDDWELWDKLSENTQNTIPIPTKLEKVGVVINE